MASGDQWVQKIPTGSVVKLQRGGEEKPIVGTLVADPSQVNVFIIKEIEGEGSSSMIVRPDEVLKLEVVKEPIADAPAPRFKRLFFVRTLEELERTVESLANEPRAGLNIVGRGEGRTLVPAFLLIALPYDLVFLDLLALPNALNVLRKVLLESEAVEKVVFDVRLLTDFLFHAHAIRMTNVYDVMIGTLMEADHPQPMTVLDLLRREGIGFEEMDQPREDIFFIRPLVDASVMAWCLLSIMHLLEVRERQGMRKERDVRDLASLAMEEMESCSESDALALLTLPGLGVKVVEKVARRS